MYQILIVFTKKFNLIKIKNVNIIKVFLIDIKVLAGEYEEIIYKFFFFFGKVEAPKII